MDEPRSQPVQPTDLAAGALAFARELGPCSARLLSDPATQALVLSRLRAGSAVEDAVLGRVHAGAANDRELANEFLGHFLADVLRVGRARVSEDLRRFFDTWDLAQSVLGDLCADLTTLRFETRGQFVSLLAKRLAWKATDRARDMKRARRREDLRVADAPEDVTLDPRTPSSFVSRQEETWRMVLVLRDLSERDRLLLGMHLRAEPLQALMDATGLSYEATRKALQRAIQRARQELARRSG